MNKETVMKTVNEFAALSLKTRGEGVTGYITLSDMEGNEGMFLSIMDLTLRLNRLEEKYEKLRISHNVFVSGEIK